MENYAIENFKNGFMSYVELINYFGNRELTDKKLKEYEIDLLDRDIISYYENEIDKAKNKEEIKDIVRRLFNNENIDDLVFSEFIDNDILNKLIELGVEFNFDEESTYEIILKEEY